MLGLMVLAAQHRATHMLKGRTLLCKKLKLMSAKFGLIVA